MAVLGQWRQFLRVREESSFNASNPETANEWQQVAGANGWLDAIDDLNGAGLQQSTPLIFPSAKAGRRFMNNAAPVAGAQEVALGPIVMPVYPDLIIPWMRSCLGTKTITPTAGTAALASTAFASVATLDTQPSTLEQLKFVIASSTAASGASIDIIQNSVTVETITIPDSGSSVDGNYYSKGAYDGSTNAITFSISGTVTSGTVVISGVKSNATNLKFSSSAAASLVVEQAARVEEGSANSEFFPGCKVPTMSFAYDRRAVDNLLLATFNISGLQPTVATSTTYANDAAAGSVAGYLPFAGWTAAIQIDDVDNTEIMAATININSNDEHYATSSGSQSPTGAIEGMAEFTANITLLPGSTTRWDDYQAATSRKIEIEFLTPHYINATTPYQFKITSNNAYIETYTRGNEGAAQSAEILIRGVYNSTDSGPCQVDVRSRMPV